MTSVADFCLHATILDIIPKCLQIMSFRWSLDFSYRKVFGTPWSVPRIDPDAFLEKMPAMVNKMLIWQQLLISWMACINVPFSTRRSRIVWPSQLLITRYNTLHYITRLYKTYKIFNSLPVRLWNSFIHFPGCYQNSAIRKFSCRTMVHYYFFVLLLSFHAVTSQIDLDGEVRKASRNWQLILILCKM